MLIVKIIGGLGNQLRIYAYAHAVSKIKNEELILDISDYCQGYKWSYALDAFNIPDHAKIYDMKLFEKYNLNGELFTIESEKYKDIESLKPIILNHANIYITGYGKKNICSEYHWRTLSQFFVLKKEDFPINRAICQIQKENSVSVHIRRGDFLYENNWIDSDEYYFAAIRKVYRKCKNPVFYFFIDKDSKDYLLNVFGDKANYRYVILPGGQEEDWASFYLMSLCQFHIVSTKSTFSELSAKITDNPHKYIIGNKMFYKRMKDSNMYFFNEIHVSRANIIIEKILNFAKKTVIKETENIKRYIDYEYLNNVIKSSEFRNMEEYINLICLDSANIEETDWVYLLKLKAISALENKKNYKAETIAWDLIFLKQEDFFIFYSMFEIFLKNRQYVKALLFYKKAGLDSNALENLSKDIEYNKSHFSRLIEKSNAFSDIHIIIIVNSEEFHPHLNNLYITIGLFLEQFNSTVSIISVEVKGGFDNIIKSKRLVSNLQSNIRVYMVSTENVGKAIDEIIMKDSRALKPIILDYCENNECDTYGQDNTVIEIIGNMNYGNSDENRMGLLRGTVPFTMPWYDTDETYRIITDILLTYSDNA